MTKKYNTNIIYCYVFDLDNTLLDTDNLFTTKILGKNFLENYNKIQVDDELVDALDNLVGIKMILTNASRAHAYKSLQKLGIQQQFVAMVDAEHTSPFIKPSPVGYKLIESITLQMSNTAHWRYVFFDDLHENLIQPKKRGWTTVLILRHENGYINSKITNKNAFGIFPYADYIFYDVKDAIKRFSDGSI